MSTFRQFPCFGYASPLCWVFFTFASIKSVRCICNRKEMYQTCYITATYIHVARLLLYAMVTSESRKHKHIPFPCNISRYVRLRNEMGANLWKGWVLQCFPYTIAVHVMTSCVPIEIRTSTHVFRIFLRPPCSHTGWKNVSCLGWSSGTPQKGCLCKGYNQVTVLHRGMLIVKSLLRDLSSAIGSYCTTYISAEW